MLSEEVTSKMTHERTAIVTNILSLFLVCQRLQWRESICKFLVAYETTGHWEVEGRV